jgi:hypothetical protein
MFKFDDDLTIWFCMSYKGAGILNYISGRLNGMGYIDILHNIQTNINVRGFKGKVIHAKGGHMKNKQLS